MGESHSGNGYILVSSCKSWRRLLPSSGESVLEDEVRPPIVGASSSERIE